MHIKFEWDEEKRQRTLRDRGIDFAVMVEFDWDSAEVLSDDRRDYGEQRLRVTGLINERLFVAIVTPRKDAVRIISLRKANPREKKRWKNIS